jgi:hypothetical protein
LVIFLRGPEFYETDLLILDANGPKVPSYTANRVPKRPVRFESVRVHGNAVSSVCEFSCVDHASIFPEVV